MAVIIDGTAGIANNATDLSYTGTLTGGTGVVNLGSGQVYKDASGNVGIGTSSPAAKLDVFGTAKVYTGGPNSSYPASVLAVRQGSSDTTNIGLLVQGGVGSTSKDIVSIGYDNAGTHVGLIRVNNSADLICTNNVLVGTTSVSAITGEATAKFQAAGNAVFGNAVASTNVTVTVNGVVNKAGRIGFAESGGIKWLIGNGAASENGVFEVFSNTTGTGVQLGRNATSWSAASDERVKTTLVPFENAASKVAALRAGTARYLTDVDSMSRSFLSAQSVQAVLPEAVDANTDEQATLSLRYTDVIPLLVAAIQELKAIVDTQAISITALNERLTALEAPIV